jgi:hypothetical protein
MICEIAWLEERGEHSGNTVRGDRQAGLAYSRKLATESR